LPSEVIFSKLWPLPVPELEAGLCDAPALASADVGIALSFDQRLLECNLKISPLPSEIRWIHDAFGNCITLVDFSSATTVLRFDTFIMLDHHLDAQQKRGKKSCGAARGDAIIAAFD
jgi:hypothetical protein